MCKCNPVDLDDVRLVGFAPLCISFNLFGSLQNVYMLHISLTCPRWEMIVNATASRYSYCSL